MTTTIDRILGALDNPRLVDQLADLGGADLTSLLLEVMRRRAANVTPGHVLEQYRRDRFTVLPSVGHAALHRAEACAEAALPTDHSMITLAPLVPFGMH